MGCMSKLTRLLLWLMFSAVMRFSAPLREHVAVWALEPICLYCWYTSRLLFPPIKELSCKLVVTTRTWSPPESLIPVPDLRPQDSLTLNMSPDKLFYVRDNVK